MRDWCVGMLKKCWLNAREAQWNEWVLKKKNLLTTFGTFFFYLLQCLVANVMVFCGGHSRGKNNCKCFVCSVHMLFAERERECPTYLVLNQTLDSVTFCITWKCKSGWPCCVKRTWEIASHIGQNSGLICFSSLVGIPISFVAPRQYTSVAALEFL